MTLLLLWCGAAVALQRPLAARRAVARRASDDGVVGPGRMPVDEGAISAHEFSRSFNAAPLGAPSTEEELTDLQKQVLLRKSTEPQGHCRDQLPCEGCGHARRRRLVGTRSTPRPLRGD